jgi:hypothetical protein
VSETPLPRGVWFEAARNRYRIRRYRNGRPYIAYRDTPEEAKKAYEEISRKLEAVPKLKRGERKQGPVPVGTFAGLTKALLLTSKS